MKSMTKEQHESYKDAKICSICLKKCENKYLKHKEYFKVGDYFHYTTEYRGAAHSICTVFHYGSNYDYHAIIKKLSRRI